MGQISRSFSPRYGIGGLTAAVVLLLVALTLAACGGPEQPKIGTAGRVSLVFFYTEG